MAETRFAFEAIGTAWNIELFDAAAGEHAGGLREVILARINTFDAHYSRFRDDSLVTRMSRKAGEYMLPPDAKPLLDLYRQLYKITGSAVTPLIGQTLVSAGYDADYSLRPGDVAAPPRWEDVVSYKFPRITLKQPALLDFGAAGKGYLVDIIGELLEEKGIRSYCIDAGGDILYKTASDAALEIALEHPADSGLAAGVARIHNQSLCGSAGNRRAWGKYHHIINPATLESPRHIAGLWVVADSGLLADGLSTALFFAGPEVLQEHFSFEYAIMGEDHSLKHSPGFPAEFFTKAV
jgi:thiamine biosynthesis lipoprotein